MRMGRRRRRIAAAIVAFVVTWGTLECAYADVLEDFPVEQEPSDAQPVPNAEASHPNETETVHAESSEVVPSEAGARAHQPSAPGVALPREAPLPETRAVRTALPPKYSLPWGLRPAAIPNVVRLDTGFASRDPDPKVNTSAVMASTLTLGLRLSDEVGVVAKGVFVQRFDSAPNGTAVGNPLLGVLYAPRLGHGLRLGFFLGFVLPLGSTGSDASASEMRGLLRAGTSARGSMDNALFAVSYATKVLGLGLSYVEHGLTAQVEGSTFVSVRTRGELVDSEPTRGAFTAGVHFGYAILDWLYPSVELRHQRWLSTPAQVVSNPASRDSTTLALGIRADVQWGARVLFRPGLAYVEPLDAPLLENGTRMVQVDLPIVFR